MRTCTLARKEKLAGKHIAIYPAHKASNIMSNHEGCFLYCTIAEGDEPWWMAGAYCEALHVGSDLQSGRTRISHITSAKDYINSV